MANELSKISFELAKPIETSSTLELKSKYDCIGLTKGSFAEVHGLIFNYDF